MGIQPKRKPVPEPTNTTFTQLDLMGLQCGHCAWVWVEVGKPGDCPNCGWTFDNELTPAKVIEHEHEYAGRGEAPTAHEHPANLPPEHDHPFASEHDHPFEGAGGVAAHEEAANPHVEYLQKTAHNELAHMEMPSIVTQTELRERVKVHENKKNPHPAYVTRDQMTRHEDSSQSHLLIRIGGAGGAGAGTPGPQGEQGIQGEQGLPGEDGAPGTPAPSTLDVHCYASPDAGSSWLPLLVEADGTVIVAA